ncbi:MAG: glycosyltransferase family 2 protein [Proteobacteria bacterium]|nr:glycosyltransferase family 2 protein [Pseudomonadota bacterium]
MAPDLAPSTSPWQGVWIAIPAYNEARTIRAVAQAALALCPRVLIVDDGSSDATVSELDGLPVTLLQHRTNRGKAASLRTAFAHAVAGGADCVVALDGDGQHDPADATALLAAWRAEPDRIVIGARLGDRSQIPVARYRANRFACFWISWAAGHPIADSQSGFRVYAAPVMRLANSGRVKGDRFTFESEILIEAADQGFRTLAVAIPGRYPPQARASHFRPVVDIAKIVVMVGTRLLKKGMYPQGLWRSLRPAPVLPPRIPPQRSATGRERPFGETRRSSR